MSLAAFLVATCVPGSEAALPAQPIAAPEPGEEGGTELDGLLERLGRVAGLYRDSALQFSCDEEVTGTGLAAAPYRFEYIYVYSPSQGLKDYRTVPGARHPREVDPGAYRIPQFLRRAYSWAFVFGADARQHHQYAIAGEDDALGRAALKVTFEPIPPFRRDVNEWFGTAWVDRETFQILKVEALHEEQRKQKEFEAELASPPAERARRKRYPIERVTTEFSVEKNGMRFPGKVTIALSEFVVPGEGGSAPFDQTLVYRIEQNYANYRFFSVRTRDEIRALVSGASRPE